jgi:hypothetical protein
VLCFRICLVLSCVHVFYFVVRVCRMLGNRGAIFGHFNIIMKHFGPVLGRCWAHLLRILGPIWSLSSHPGDLGAFLGHLGPTLGHLGLAWGHLGSYLAQHGIILGL